MFHIRFVKESRRSRWKETALPWPPFHQHLFYVFKKVFATDLSPITMNSSRNSLNEWFTQLGDAHSPEIIQWAEPIGPTRSSNKITINYNSIKWWRVEIWLSLCGYWLAINNEDAITSPATLVTSSATSISTAFALSLISLKQSIKRVATTLWAPSISLRLSLSLSLWRSWMLSSSTNPIGSQQLTLLLLLLLLLLPLLPLFFFFSFFLFFFLL